VQQELVWENPAANRDRFQALLDTERLATDIVVLPEMFTTGFSMNAAGNAEPAGGETQAWMQALARSHDCAITGSVVVREGGQIYNRLLFVTPDAVHHYDKRHLFRMAGEHEHYASGSKRVVIAWRGWRVKPEICYDLRFPVFSRNRDDYDLLLYVANWPSPRAHHWRSLLVARAIENRAAVVGVNRVGSDGNGHDYAGDSVAIDMSGELLCDLADRQAVKTVLFDGEALLAYRKRFPFQLDADEFTLQT
jgi:predicted amidohydrolase